MIQQKPTFAVRTMSQSTFVKSGKFFQVCKDDEWIPVVVFGRLDSLSLCQYLVEDHDFHELLSVPLFSRLVDMQTFNHPHHGLVLLVLTEDGMFCVYSVLCVDGGRFDVELLQEEVLELSDSANLLGISVDPHARLFFLIDRQLRNLQCWIATSDSKQVPFKHDHELSRAFTSYQHDILINCFEFMYTSMLVDSSKIILLLQVEKLFSNQPALYMFEFELDPSINVESVYELDLSPLPRISFMISLKQCPDSVLCISDQCLAFVLTRSSIINTDTSKNDSSDTSLTPDIFNSIDVKSIVGNDAAVGSVLVDVMRHECIVDDAEVDKIDMLYYMTSDGSLYQLEANYSSDFDYELLLDNIDCVPDMMFALPVNERLDIFIRAAFGDSLICGKNFFDSRWEVKGVVESSYPFQCPMAMNPLAKTSELSICGLSKTCGNSTCIKELQQSIQTSILSYTDSGTFPAANGLWICDTDSYGRIILVSFMDETACLKITDDHTIENITAEPLNNSQYLSQSFHFAVNIPICSNAKTIYAGTSSTGALIQVTEKMVLLIVAELAVENKNLISDNDEIICSADSCKDYVVILTSMNRLLLLQIRETAIELCNTSSLSNIGIASLGIGSFLLETQETCLILAGTHTNDLLVFSKDFDILTKVSLDGVIESILINSFSVFIGTRNGIFIHFHLSTTEGGIVALSEKYRCVLESSIPVVLSKIIGDVTSNVADFIVKTDRLRISRIDQSGNPCLLPLSVPTELEKMNVAFSCSIHPTSICIYDDGTLALLRIRENTVTIKKLVKLSDNQRKAVLDIENRRLLTQLRSSNSVTIFDSDMFQLLKQYDLFENEMITDICFYGDLYVLSTAHQASVETGSLILINRQDLTMTFRISFQYSIQCFCPINEKMIAIGSSRSIELILLENPFETVTVLAKYQMRWPVNTVKYNQINNVLIVGSKRDGVTLFKITGSDEGQRFEFLRSEKRSSNVKELHVLPSSTAVVLDTSGNIYGFHLQKRDMERLFSVNFQDTLIGMCPHEGGVIAASILGRLIHVFPMHDEFEASIFACIQLAMENSKGDVLQKHRWIRHGINKHGLSQNHRSINATDLDFISQFINCHSIDEQKQILSDAKRHFDSVYPDDQSIKWDLDDIRKRFSRLICK